MKPTASIIIPTWNNAQYLDPCVISIMETGVLSGLCELIIVNNGSEPIDTLVRNWPNTKVLKAPGNLGWERGLEFGIKHAQGDFLCFQNDDTLIPKACQGFYNQLLWPFNDQNIAAVGPATTIAAGRHSVFQRQQLRAMTEASYLIFFTAMLRRSDYEAVGGIDTSCPGGDDIDLSIRLRKYGKKLVINPDAFLIHHAFKTGERVRGGPNDANGWNSAEMRDRTNHWLIRQHGFKTFRETITGLDYVMPGTPPDSEGELVASWVQGEKVYELGCGFRKTVPQAIGIDQAGPGEMPSNLADQKESVADIKADVSKPLPVPEFSADTVIARHILEHCIDSVKTLENWNQILKFGGRLIIAVPNEQIIKGIPMNPEHCHAFTPESLQSLACVCGFRSIGIGDPKNGISFVACFEKVAHLVPVSELVEPLHA